MDELRNTVILLLIISGVMVGFGMFATDLATNYGTSIDDPSFISKANDSLSLIGNMAQDTQDLDFNVIEFVFTAPFKVVKLTFNAVKITGSMFSDLGGAVGVPMWVITVITGILLVIVVYSVISAYIKYRV